MWPVGRGRSRSACVRKSTSEEPHDAGGPGPAGSPSRFVPPPSTAGPPRRGAPSIPRRRRCLSGSEATATAAPVEALLAREGGQRGAGPHLEQHPIGLLARARGRRTRSAPSRAGAAPSTRGSVASSARIQVPVTVETNGMCGADSRTPFTTSAKGSTTGPSSASGRRARSAARGRRRPFGRELGLRAQRPPPCGPDDHAQRGAVLGGDGERRRPAVGSSASADEPHREHGAPGCRCIRRPRSATSRRASSSVSTPASAARRTRRRCGRSSPRARRPSASTAGRGRTRSRRAPAA